MKTQAVAEQEFSEYPAKQYPTYQKGSLKKVLNKKQEPVCQSRFSSRQNLSCPCIKLPNWHTLVFDGVETGNSLSDFAQYLSCINEDVPDIYFTLLDAAGTSPTLALNQNATAKERKLGPFQNMNVRSCKDCTRKEVLLMDLGAI